MNKDGKEYPISRVGKMMEGKKRFARGWRAHIPFTIGSFICDYLSRRGEAYIFETWDAFRRAVRERGIRWWGL